MWPPASHVQVSASSWSQCAQLQHQAQVSGNEIPALKSQLGICNLSSRDFSASFSFFDFSLALKSEIKMHHGNDQLGRVKQNVICKPLSIQVSHNPLRAGNGGNNGGKHGGNKLLINVLLSLIIYFKKCIILRVLNHLGVCDVTLNHEFLS